MTADEGATCLVLLGVDTGDTRAVLAAGKTVTHYLVKRAKRFVEEFFRRRVRPESVVLERTPRHDGQANPTDRAIRTLEEQVKVMRLDLRSDLEPSSFQTRAGGCG